MKKKTRQLFLLHTFKILSPLRFLYLSILHRPPFNGDISNVEMEAFAYYTQQNTYARRLQQMAYCL